LTRSEILERRIEEQRSLVTSLISPNKRWWFDSTCPIMLKECKNIFCSKTFETESKKQTYCSIECRTLRKCRCGKIIDATARRCRECFAGEPLGRLSSSSLKKTKIK